MVRAYTFSYTPQPTLSKFHNSIATIKAVAGPPGGGKSVGIIMDIVFMAMRQEPGYDNVRRIRVGVIRKTFRRLRSTTLVTIKSWMIPGTSTFTHSAPMTGFTQFGMSDGTRCEIDWQFMALDTKEDLENLSSNEFTLIYINEANEIDISVVMRAIERIDRYPSRITGAKCTEAVLLMDFNYPDKRHWLYTAIKEGKLATEGDIDTAGLDVKPMKMEFFVQPPAVFIDNYEAANSGEEPPQYRLNPNAENLENVEPDYYLRQLTFSTWDTVCSRLALLWRTSTRGKRCHPEIREHHFSDTPLEYVPGETIFIGFDTSGIHPGAVLFQLLRNQMRVLMEVYADAVGTEEFIKDYLKPILVTRYPQSNALAICDPANARDQRTAVTPTDLLKEYGIAAITAPSNGFTVRKNAVAKQASYHDGLIIDAKNCPLLKEGLLEKYVHARLRGGDELNVDESNVIYLPKHQENKWTHVCCGLQYGCLFIVSPRNNQNKNDVDIQKLTKRKNI